MCDGQWQTARRADGTPSGNGTPQPNGFSGDTAMCGGPWRNSVYQQSTTNWEKAG